jgi:hypothetical protein
MNAELLPANVVVTVRLTAVQAARLDKVRGSRSRSSFLRALINDLRSKKN